MGRFLEPDPIGFLGGVNFYAYVGNNPVNFVDLWGWCGEKSTWNKLKDNYNDILKDLYGNDLEIADALGLWGLGSLATSVAVDGYVSLTDVLAVEQINNAKIAGALESGDIFAKMAAAEKGASLATRTTVLQSTMRVVSKISAVITAGGTGYSIGARLNAATQAVIRTFR